jgi:cell wall-associated NlpC family hydrolase
MREDDGGSGRSRRPAPTGGGAAAAVPRTWPGSATEVGRPASGDLAFYDGGDGTVDHVNLYVGNGYALTHHQRGRRHADVRGARQLVPR